MTRRMLGDLTDVSLDPYVPYNPATVFPISNLSSDLFGGGGGNAGSIVDDGFLSGSGNGALQVNLSSLTPNTDLLNFGTNPTTTADSGMSTGDWLKAIGDLTKAGLTAYATVDQINRGNSLPFAIGGTGAALPAAVPETGLGSLLDFSTVTPYLIGGAALLLFMGTSGRK